MIFFRQCCKACNRVLATKHFLDLKLMAKDLYPLWISIGLTTTSYAMGNGSYSFEFRLESFDCLDLLLVYHTSHDKHYIGNKMLYNTQYTVRSSLKQ